MSRSIEFLRNTFYYKIYFFYFIKDSIKKIGQFQQHCRRPKHVLFLFADHFEPVNDIERVDRWLNLYKKQIRGHVDSDGIPPQHTWFYPCEQLNYEILKKLSHAVFEGLGEIELHLHHKNDNSETLRAKLEKAKEEYSKVGAFINENDLKGRFGFIHGDWALDNSRFRSKENYCGVSDEITILRDLGCYADFTFPSYEIESEPKKMNSIYYATDDPLRPKSYEKGDDVSSKDKKSGDLLLMQGPWVYDWSKRRYKIFPYVDCGDIASYNLPAPRRVALWMKARVHVLGCPEWIFIKVHTHGAHKSHMPVILGKDMEEIYSHLEAHYNNLEFKLHYVTAREAFNIIKAAEDGQKGDPSEYRDYIIRKPLNRNTFSNVLYKFSATKDRKCTYNIIEEKEIHLQFNTQYYLEMKGDIQKIVCYIDNNTNYEIYIKSTAEIISEKELTLTGNFNQSKLISKDGKYYYFLVK